MINRDLSLSLAEALIRSQTETGPHLSHGDGQQATSRPPFTITISREAGAMGNSVATEVGRRLDWPVYDRNILDKVAERLHRPASHLQDVDERPATWLGECMAPLFDKDHVGSDVYLKHLFAAVRALGAAGKCVIVGRGANFLLPAETTLRFRLVALPEDRARVVARRLGLSPREAEIWVKTTERDRVAFVQGTFQEDPANPYHYDLILNLSRLTVEEAGEIIIETLRRFEKRSASAKKTEEMVCPASPALA